MARVAFTLRIDTEERNALETLSKVEGRPVNQLLNEAIRGYLRRQRPKEQSLEKSLARLRAYREKDPEFKQAISEFVEAEVRLEDPLEGEWTERQSATQGPVQSKIRELLGAS
jgi:predicted transcriptional regulator